MSELVPECRGAHDDEDFGYTWDDFVEVQAFYRAAEAERAVISTAT